MIFLLVAGIYFPIPSAILGLAVFIGRLTYAVGYTMGGPKGRLIGVLINDLAILGSFVLAFISSVMFITGKQVWLHTMIDDYWFISFSFLQNKIKLQSDKWSLQRYFYWAFRRKLLLELGILLDHLIQVSMKRHWLYSNSFSILWCIDLPIFQIRLNPQFILSIFYFDKFVLSLLSLK